MAIACCVINCHNRSHDRRGKRIANGERFYSFPAWKQSGGSQIAELTKRRRMAWVSAVRHKNITFSNISRSMKVCSRHFHTGKPAYEMHESHPDWVPSLQLGHTEVNATQVTQFNKWTKRQKPPAVNAAAQQEDTGERPRMDEAPQEDTGESPRMEECNFCQQRRAEIDLLLEENRKLKEELARMKMDEHFVKDDDTKYSTR
ncbi:hypothetical protein SKAU_G00114850 [Synaphobranchus kaupii]|uniref:THAP-type domain-containing protein n=1 Tax=Synaphobranchus kaupii TaxID=118154 RepID=A0A9Q1FMP6_SYNKA|nr:hypothetical protein SKAU_G00114850 [Synaphobranchus kaupii]